MTAAQLAAALVGVAVIAGTAVDRPQERTPITLGEYRVIAADFHTHSSTWSDGSLTPWGLVLEAERRGLDAIAITGHNRVTDSHWGRWFSERVGGPRVLTGQEIISADHHMIAFGIEETIDWTLTAADQIDAVHRQGGATIAAHPLSSARGYDERALERLDGAEICHPLVVAEPSAQAQLEHFASRAPLAAIGSSDFHGPGPMGYCRTFVFARDDSAAAIVEAVRARRTVVYGLNGKAYGDPALVSLAEREPRLRQAAHAPASGWADWISRLTGLLGLAGLTLWFRGWS